MIRLDNGNQLTPDQPITRAQFIYMILTGKGISPVPTIGNHFKDVNPDDWFYPYVEMAFQIGLTNGTKKGETNYFYPNDLLTREEMVTLLVRAQGKMREAQVIPWGEATEALKSFPDQWDLEDWARRPFAYALQKGITKAYPDGLLRPKKISTVAEAASFVYRGLYLPRTNLKTAQVDGITIYYTSKIEGMKTTAYSKGEPTVPGVFTRMGLFVRKGLVAVDPNVIPLGTYLYVEGYGFAMAADTGGAIKGNVIDLYVESIEKARKHGVDYRNVYILN
ncbi:S-layer homology domain-containing protein [Microaerobacter geothermalis]|nr:S-layer homology domain-containing protein [Microaerobacter geothermalis]